MASSRKAVARDIGRPGAFHVMAVLSITLLGLAAYANSLQGPFVFDDKPNIEDNRGLHWQQLGWQELVSAVRQSPSASRPVANVSFALNYYFGRHDVLGYHVVNLAIHLLNALLVYLLALATSQRAKPRKISPLRPSVAPWIALTAALIFVSHPIQTQAVTYIVQRMTTLCTLFYLSALLLYIYGRTTEAPRRRWTLWVGSFFCSVLALGSKQIAATLPLIILLYEWYFFQDLNARWVKKNARFGLLAIVLLAMVAWAYLGNEEIKGARLLTLNDHELTRSAHELKHHIFDTTIQETEGLTVTRSHGLTDAGYDAGALGWGDRIGNLNLGPCMAYYRDCYRHYYTRDMWERWRLRPAHNRPHEPFSGKAYEWADVKRDFWFKLPQLGAEELRKLTGLENFQVFTSEAALVFETGQADDPFYGGVLPKRIGVAKSDTVLNNTLSFANESTAYVKTPTGQWLFVKPQAVDFFVDILRIRGESEQALQVYGYVLDDYKAAVAVRLPDSFPAAPDEIGLFRPLPISVETDGKSVTLTSGLKGATVRYTLDDTEPTEASPVCDGPFTLSDTTTVKARLFGKDVPQGLATWRKTFEYRPFSAKIEGLVEGSGTWFNKKATLRFTANVGGGTIRYTLDGKVPDENSAAYEGPIEVKDSTTITARYFDAEKRPRGYTWSARFDERNLAMGKPVTTSGPINPNEKPEFVVDGNVSLSKFWGTIPAPQWLQIDLEKEYRIDRVHVFPYWDGQRYYQYTVEVSTDGKTWTSAIDASTNTAVETDRGRLHTFDPIPARYLKLTMLKNSANPAVHVVEMRVFEATD